MRCFLGCFTASSKHNDSKRLNLPSPTHVTAESLPLLSSSVEIPIAEPLGEKLEEQLSRNGETKSTSSSCREKSSSDLSIVARNNEEKRGEEQDEASNESKSMECNLMSSKQTSAPLNPKQECEDVDLGEEESSESLFSISIDSRKYTTFGGAEVGEKEVSSPPPAPAPAQSVVLVRKDKASATLQTEEDKENIKTDPNTNTAVVQVWSKTAKDKKEIAVDASLSSWLNTTPLSTESESVSSQNTPILGTIGSFWHHTGCSVDSDSTSSTRGPLKKCAKDDQVRSASTPFKARFDRALCEIVDQN